MKNILLATLCLILFPQIAVAMPKSISQFEGRWSCHSETGPHTLGEQANANVVENFIDSNLADGHTQTIGASKILANFKGTPVTILLKNRMESISRLEGNTIYTRLLSYVPESSELSEESRVALERDKSDLGDGLRFLPQNLGTKTDRQMRKKIKSGEEFKTVIETFSSKAWTGHIDGGKVTTTIQCKKMT